MSYNETHEQIRRDEKAKSKHTPAPWLITAEYSRLCARDSKDRIIADCSGTGRKREEEAANANLVAAAPDLLAACEITQRTVEGCFADGFVIRVTGHEMNAIRAAIAKAKGGAHE